MKNFETEKLVKGTIITNKYNGELLQYTGYNNGNIWDFYELVFENEEDMDGHFDKGNSVRLTKSELKEYKIYD